MKTFDETLLLSTKAEHTQIAQGFLQLNLFSDFVTHLLLDANRKPAETSP